MRVALTGGIACGKSLVAKMMNELGVEVIDADDIVHEIIPAEERRRLAKIVFADPEARRRLESRVHPVVRGRIDEWLGEMAKAGKLAVAVVPLLFEVGWDADFDLVVCVASRRELQIERMISMRGYSGEEAESRIAAQMSVEEKAARSHFVVRNDGGVEQLGEKVAEAVAYIRERMKP